MRLENKMNKYVNKNEMNNQLISKNKLIRYEPNIK